LLSIIKIWLISMVVWPAILQLFLTIQGTLLSKPSVVVKNFFTQLGWTFVGAGGFGAIAGITGTSTENEILVRFCVALIFIIFFFILVFINLGEK